MTDKTILLSTEELKLLMAALASYRIKGFPLGRSSYSNAISQRDRQEWAAFGMAVWNKFSALSKEETN